MTRQEIFDKLFSIFSQTLSENINLNSLKESDRLAEDYGFSSIDILFMAVSLEEEMGIQFRDISVKDISTVKEVIDFIEKQF